MQAASSSMPPTSSSTLTVVKIGHGGGGIYLPEGPPYVWTRIWYPNPLGTKPASAR
jgi:hypothetical protein